LALALAVLLPGVARAAEPVIDFAAIARTTQLLTVQLEQLQRLQSAGTDLGRMLQVVGLPGGNLAFDASALGGLGEAGRQLGLTIRAALPGGTQLASPERLGLLVWQAALEHTAGTGRALEQLQGAALALLLQQAGLDGLQNIPGLLAQLQQSAGQLGGLGDLRSFAPPQHLLSETGTSTFGSFEAARTAATEALWQTVEPADTLVLQKVTAARRRVQSEALTAGYPMALLLRTETARQPARLEQLAADAAAATTLAQQLQHANKAALALLQSSTRIEAALSALLSVETSAALQDQPATVQAR
jgi:hypothetical protein